MIDVLLATCRPDPAALKAQLDSIRAQRGVEVNLLRREDSGGEGPRGNFAALLAESTAEYAAFADQDDVWMDDKLARAMAKMRDLEERWGKDAPLMVYTDATVVDAELRPLDTSLFHRIKVDPLRTRPEQLAVQNVAYGNTILMNAALRQLANPIPEKAFMHDSWVTLVAGVFGRMECLREPTLLYRQHGGNAIGGRKVGFGYFLSLARGGRSELRARLYANVRQVEAFVARFGDKAPASFRALVGLERRCWPARVWILLRHQFFKNGLLRNLGMLLVA